MVTKTTKSQDCEPIRVAQIMGKLWAGGVETVVFNYYKEIEKSKVQFDFYYDDDSTVEPPAELIKMGARFYKIPRYQNLIPYLTTLKKYFHKNNYIIVHSHINSLSVFPLFIAWAERIPVRIAHNHSVPGGNEWKKNILKNCLKIFAKMFSTEYFACSEKAGRWLFGDKSYERGQILIVKNAIDFNRYIFKNEETMQLANQLGIENKFVVGHVGRFTYAKNHLFLLNVFKKIEKTRGNSILLLVGDGELHQQIVDAIRKMHLCDKVIMTGQVSNPEKYYQLMDVVVLPSIFEGFSMTTIEAQMSKVPVVVSNAVSKEACISNACKYIDLTADTKIWANAALEMANRKVQLTRKSTEYDITKNAIELAEWYQKKYKVNC